MKSSEYIEKISREYGMYVLDKRAIPAMTDGLKSGQRISLWLLRNRSDKIKTIALAGQMIASELYLHGDSAAADSIAMLAGPYCNNQPLIKGIGAFGTRTNPTSFAAPRYTSVKRSKFAQEVLYVDSDIITMIDNHDGSNVMPKTFLPLIPLVMLNGIKGIATGWATNILPRKYEDLIEAVKDVLTTGKVQRDLLPHYNNRNMQVIREHGHQNKFIIKGCIERKNTSTILVTELPPELNLESFRDKLSSLEDSGKITGWTDNSTKDINIEVKLRRDVLAKMSDNQLIEMLKLRSITTENITVQGLDGNSIVSYDSVNQLIEDWVSWRLGLYLTRYEKLLKDELDNNLYWQYVIACFNYHLTSSIQKLESKKELEQEISDIGKNADLPVASDNILDKISSLPTYKWTHKEFLHAEKQLKESNKNIELYQGMIQSDTKRKNVFKKEVDSLRVVP